MKKGKIYISTIADDAADTAEKYGLGLEAAEYCTAFNMDELFEETDALLKAKLARVPSGNFVFHAPFNELSPAAIDPKVLAVTKERYMQAINLAKTYGMNKIVIHSGFYPNMYYDIWFEERSVEFWKSFLAELPGDVEILYENVFERTPEQLLKIAELVGHERFKLCFDIGHAHVIPGELTVLDWLKTYAPYISHFHIHNNHGEYDEHNGLADGTIDMAEFLRLAEELCPDATYTLEIMYESEPSVKWLIENGFID